MPGLSLLVLLVLVAGCLWVLLHLGAAGRTVVVGFVQVAGVRVTLEWEESGKCGLQLDAAL